jgi:hypothetical protein
VLGEILIITVKQAAESQSPGHAVFRQYDRRYSCRRCYRVHSQLEPHYDVQDLGSAGQLIPLVIGGGLIIRVTYIGIFRKGKSKEEIGSDDDEMHAHSMVDMPGAAYGGAGRPDPVYHFPTQAAPYSEHDGLDRFPVLGSAGRY